MESVADDLMRTPPSQWEATLQRWVQFATEASRAQSAPRLNVDEVLSIVRTRIIATAEADGYDYGRPFAEGLFQVLCLDYPTHVVTLTDKNIGDLEVPLDALFGLGQIDTDAEPIDETFDEGGVHFVTGGSTWRRLTACSSRCRIGRCRCIRFRRAKKASPVSSPSPRWLAPSPPRRGLTTPGGLLSRNVFYWAPDGTVEPQMGSYQVVRDRAISSGHDFDLPESDTLVVRPGMAFSRRFIERPE